MATLTEFGKADMRTLDNKVNHSLLDTNDINKMIKKILNKMAVKVSFYNSRYFDMHCKLLQHLINWKGMQFFD
jgi:hypothetical protein